VHLADLTPTPKVGQVMGSLKNLGEPIQKGLSKTLHLGVILQHTSRTRKVCNDLVKVAHNPPEVGSQQRVDFRKPLGIVF